MQLANLTTAEGRAVGLLYALPGALAGLALWSLATSALDVPEGLLAFVVPAIVVGVGSWTLVTAPGDRRGALAFSLAAAAGSGALSWSAWHAFGEAGLGRAALALPLIGWIALSFYRSRRDSGRLAHYPALFAMGWNLPVVLAVAQAFTWGAYGVLWLLAALFRLIGIPQLTQLLAEPAVSAALIGGLGAAGVGVVRRQESILLTLRGVVIALLRVLAPVFAFGTLAFSLALLVQGLGGLWEGWSPVVLIVATITAGVVFVNAVVQDRDAAGGVLGIAARTQSLVLPVLAVLAAYGMGLRIGEHGLTPDRIVASIIAGFALLYAAAYAAAALFGWGLLRRANVALAGLLALVAAYSLTPLFAIDEWSVANQLARLESGAVSPAAFDYAAFRFDLGEPGGAALERLAAGGGPASRNARAALDAEYRYEVQDEPDLDARRRAYLAAAPVRPEGAALPDALIGKLTSRLYATDVDAEDTEEVFLLMSGYDGARDAVLWLRRADAGTRVTVALWREAGDEPVASRAWFRDEDYHRDFDTAEEAATYMRAARTAPFGPAPVTIIVPSVDGEPFLPDDGRRLVLAPPPPAR